MDEKERVERILVLGIKATTRLAFEAAITCIEDLEKQKTMFSSQERHAYRAALRDAKEEIGKLLAAFAE